ncbi:hypothetical protein CYMTET_47487 [Cymbomonas tetramitiformis]|uniref:Glucosamine 6-phosphate N-acetyltransferase n=1 Tax=Cymbomonas tetramitiformis TaxID=36881 RepID=A0AAE0BU33_9CHLO|nr:hypothetical protein CYMTET_47487 [Cymbomonas tetramitiformis]
MLKTRPLEAEDFTKGYLELLADLTTVGTIDQAAFEGRLHELQSNNDYSVIVIEDTDEKMVVATGTVMVERKFIHECGKARQRPPSPLFQILFTN